MKELLRRLFAATLHDLDAGHAMTPVLDRYRERAARGERFVVLAYGKAARAMAQAVVDQLRGASLRGLVVPPEPDGAPLPPFDAIAGGHPVPTAGSLRAGQRALELARSARADETVLFLASGGGSAMLEWPLDERMTLADVQAFHRTLVGSGAGIVAINEQRVRVSAVKGGRLALAAAGAREHATITVSDVPRGWSHVVASGPSAPPPSGEPGPPHVRIDVADNATALAALRDHARAFGLGPFAIVDADALPGGDPPYERAAAQLLHRLERLRRRWPGRRVAVIAGGELSVPLPPDAGTGGRNQQFVLACARLIRGRPITVLSCGTDGVDGNSPAAGAIADGTTMLRAHALGLDVHGALARCDAFPLLQALGDTVVTGHTGTNVRDVRILVHAR